MSRICASRLISMAGIIAGSLLWSAAANAQTISIGLEGVQVGASWSGADPLGGSVSGSNGVFSARVTATGFPGLGFGNPVPLLDGNAITVGSVGSGTLHIAITEQGLATIPGNIGVFLSTYTVNGLTGPLTVTEQTYYDAGNGLFALTTPLGAGFTATTPSGVGPNASSLHRLSTLFSVTELFTITATAAGSTNDTINLAYAFRGGSGNCPQELLIVIFSHF